MLKRVWARTEAIRRPPPRPTSMYARLRPTPVWFGFVRIRPLRSVWPFRSHGMKEMGLSRPKWVAETDLWKLSPQAPCRVCGPQGRLTTTAGGWLGDRHMPGGRRSLSPSKGWFSLASGRPVSGPIRARTGPERSFPLAARTGNFYTGPDLMWIEHRAGRSRVPDPCPTPVVQLTRPGRDTSTEAYATGMWGGVSRLWRTWDTAFDWSVSGSGVPLRKIQQNRQPIAGRVIVSRWLSALNFLILLMS